MSMQCSVCSHENPDDSRFCVSCGNEVVQATSTRVSSLMIGSAQTSGNLTTPASSTQPDQRRQISVAHARQPAQMGTGQVSATEGSVARRRAFAGYGVPVMHHSWLLDGEAAQAGAISSAIAEVLHQRSFANLRLSQNNLRERGFQTEERRYLVVRRGVATVFIYVAPAGRDLYISRATSILPAIDTLRVAFLGTLIGVAFFLPGILAASSPVGYLFSGLFSLISWPIWVYVLWMALRSFRYWLVEKDFWIYLRTRALNDFQLDDIMLLEHATDESISVAVKQSGLDASKITPPAQGYQPQRHIRVI